MEATQELLPASVANTPVKFNITDTAISVLRDKLTGLKADTPAGYRLVQQGIAETRTLRVNVEATRKALKEDALKYGRIVDAEAKRITAMLEEIEEPLKLEKQKADEAKEQAKREAEQAKREALGKRIAALQAVECFANPLDVAEWDDVKFDSQLALATQEYEEKQRKLAEQREAAEKAEAERIEALRIEQERLAAERAERAELDRLRAEEDERRKIEQAKIDEANRIERQRLAEERAKLEEQNRIERERIEAEAAKVQAERDRLAADEAARKHAEETAKRQAEEAKRIEAEKASEAERKAAAEKAAAELAEAMKPDVEKIRDLGKTIAGIVLPECSHDNAKQFVDRAREFLTGIREACEEFGQ